MEEKETVTTTIAETENYLAWKADEPDGETTYHLELNNVTLHFFKEEWEEFLKLTEIIIDEELQFKSGFLKPEGSNYPKQLAIAQAFLVKHCFICIWQGKWINPINQMKAVLAS